MAGNFSTPNFNTTSSELSSVFMTPSSSTGKPIYRKPKFLTPLPPLSFLSPAASPEMSRTALKAQESADSEEHKDILLELREYGIPGLVDRILSFLSPADLYNCLQVSHKWHDVISSKPRYIEQIRSHLKSLTENTKKPSLSLNFNSSFGARRALGTISQNTINSHSRNVPPLSSSSYKAEQTQKHHPCPSCGSPARQLNLRRTVCTNPICRLDFCQRCFRRWHEGECVENRGSRSPKRGQNTLIACSQKSKKRLRRL